MARNAVTGKLLNYSVVFSVFYTVSSVGIDEFHNIRYEIRHNNAVLH